VLATASVVEVAVGLVILVVAVVAAKVVDDACDTAII